MIYLLAFLDDYSGCIRAEIFRGDVHRAIPDTDEYKTSKGEPGAKKKTLTDEICKTVWLGLSVALAEVVTAGGV